MDNHHSIHTLIVNLGSPKSSSESDVATFLRSMLMDRHLLRMPWLMRAFLVNAIVIPRRKARVSALYNAIWEDGKQSPLSEITQNLVRQIEERLRDNDSLATISFAMRHGDEDSISREIERLSKRGVERLLVIPMYPQYEVSTYQSVVDEVKRATTRCGINETLFVPPFYNHGDYISALERSVREALNGVKVDRLIVSFHSIPLRYDGDSYRAQCEQTASLLCERLGIEKGEYNVVYQSNMRHKGWLEPTLFSALESLPKEGVQSVAVIAPSFTADCLETLSEIDIEGREIFRTNGGVEFHYIPALNTLDLWVKKLTKWIIEANSR